MFGLLILDGFHNWGDSQLWAEYHMVRGENSAIDIVF